MNTFLFIAFAIAIIWVWKNVAKGSAGQAVPAPVHISGRSFNSKVVGVSHDNPDGTSRQKIIKANCKAGQALQLKPEPDNPYDHNAIGVWIPAGQIGYIASGRLADDLSTHMKRGTAVSASIDEVTGGKRDQPMCGVNIAIHIDQ